MMELSLESKQQRSIRVIRIRYTGNSGNSSRPHLHISAIKGTVKWEGPPAPIPFHDIQVLGLSILNSQANQPWVEVEGMGLPAEDAAILPFIGDISPLDLNKFNAIVNILGLGVLKGGEGTGYTPSGKPIHIGPSDPGGMVRLSPDKRDILVGLAMTEIASVVSNSEAKQKIVKVGLDVISSAVNNLRKPPIHDE